MISIIIPVYNSGKYLRKCLDSIKNQTKKEFEVIIIDDGSTDNSYNIINEYLNDERFKVIKQENHGIGYSRNVGIEKSTGKYLVFIDSDDYVELNFLELMFKKAEKDNLDIVVCDYIEENIENNKQKKVIIPDFDNTSVDNNPEILLGINKSPWNKIIKKSAINNIRFPENLKYEDTQFICEILKNTKIGKINKCLNHYVIHSKSETTTMNEKVFDILKIINNIRDMYIQENNVGDVLEKLTLQILTTYTIQQRYQKSDKIRNDFIDATFKYICDNIPEYKKNKYFKERGIRGFVEKNKIITKIYCLIYNKLFLLF